MIWKESRFDNKKVRGKEEGWKMMITLEIKNRPDCGRAVRTNINPTFPHGVYYVQN